MLFKIQTSSLMSTPQFTSIILRQARQDLKPGSQMPKLLGLTNHHAASITRARSHIWGQQCRQLMAKLYALLQIPPPTISSHGWEESEAAGSIRGHCSLNTTYPGWGLCGQGDPPPKPLGTKGYPFPSGDRPGTCRVYLDALSSAGQPWVSSH